MDHKQRQDLSAALSKELAQVLGDALDGVILYGSTARGEARSDSDIDILIVIRGPLDYGNLIHKTSALVARLSLEHDVVISRAFISRERFENEHSPFIMNVQREGIPL